MFIPPFRSSTPRAGFTVVELLVAIILFSVGFLALAGSSAIVLRRLYHAHSRTSAAAVTSSRIAKLASRRCSLPDSGSQNFGAGIVETWRAESAGSGLLRARITVTYTSTGRSDHFETVVPCR